MEDFTIPDEQIKSSNDMDPSSNDDPDTAPFGRLNRKLATLPNGQSNPIMAWLVDSNVPLTDQWLQVKLQTPAATDSNMCSLSHSVKGKHFNSKLIFENGIDVF